MTTQSGAQLPSLKPNELTPTSQCLCDFVSFFHQYNEWTEQQVERETKKSGLCPSDAQDVYAGTWKSLLPYFEGKCCYVHKSEDSDKGLIKAVIRSRIIDLVRKRQRQVEQTAVELDAPIYLSRLDSSQLGEIVGGVLDFTSLIDTKVDLEEAIQEVVKREEHLLVLRYYMGEVDRSVFADYSDRYPEVTMKRIRKKIFDYLKARGW